MKSSFFKKNKFNILFILLIVSISLVMMIFMRTDPDYFWHITAGKYMINHHTILTHDVFSWFVSGKPWMSHEWLFEIIIYYMSIIFGKYHLLIYGFINVLIILLIFYFTNKENFHKNKVFGLVWLILFFIFDVFMVGRPQLISNILLALTIYFLIDLYNNKDSKKIYFLPLITIIWANVHGGSSNLPYLLAFIFMIISLFKFDIGKIISERKSKKQILTYLIVTLVCMLCVNICPHGFKMFIYPYINMGNSTMLSTISEWQPSVLSNNSHLPYFIFIFLILLVFLLSKKKLRFIDLALFIISIYLGLKSIRFWGYTYIIMTYVIFNYISPRKDDRGTEIVFLILSFSFILIFSLGFKYIIKNTNNKYISDTMINIIKKENPKRLYNDYGAGGYLVYKNIPVFIDGRADLYSDYNYKDNIEIMYYKRDFYEKFNKYNFDYLLVSDGFQINLYLKHNKDYKLIYKEDNFYFYKKVQ